MSHGPPNLRLVSIVIVACLWVVPGIFAGEDDDKLDFKGDFRYRYELIDLSDDDFAARHRHRIRSRFGLKVKVAEEARIFFQLATGSDDLVSSNQTLSGTFSSKNIVLDLAYGEYQPTAFKRRVTFIAGKSILPFFRPGATELLWDSDLRPEGISTSFNLGLDRKSLNVLAGFYILEERKNDDNSYLYASQIVKTIHVIPGLSSLKAGAGYFHFTEIQDRAPFFRDDFYGNSYYPDTTLPADPSDPPDIEFKHSQDYREIELFLETELSLREKPILLLADYVMNTEAETDDIGWLLGLKIGKVKDRGSWSIRYNYRRLEKDAVYGTFTDSNSGGGGTDGKGHEIGFSFGTFENTRITLSYFNNRVRIEDGDKYQRWMLDISSTF